MIEILTAVGGVIVLVVTLFIKHLQKKVKKQETAIKVLEQEKNIEEAKSEALRGEGRIDLETNDTLQDATLGTLKETVPHQPNSQSTKLERQAQIGNGALWT